MTELQVFETVSAGICPGCGYKESTTSTVTRKCGCGMVYTRGEETRDCVLMMPSHASLNDFPSDMESDV